MSSETLSIDLNADVGESLGHWKMGQDKLLMPWITSANIACGFHAGDAHVMMETLQLARLHHVSVGAHPSLPDLHGFGRRVMQVSPREVYEWVLYQVSALQGMASSLSMELGHVKPHGALYNMAASDQKLAQAIAQAVFDLNPKLLLMGLANSWLIKAGLDLGLRVAQEGFADRGYADSGALLPRNSPKAVFSSLDDVVAQCLHMIQDDYVLTESGRMYSMKVDTICIHGDGPMAPLFARSLHDVFQKQSIHLRSLTNRPDPGTA